MNLKPCECQMASLERVAAARETAHWRGVHRANRVSAAAGTDRGAGDIGGSAIQVRRSRRGRSGSAAFQCPVGFGTLNLLEVGNAGIGLGGRARTHKVGNRDRSQEADDGHHDHDFNEGEAGLTERINLHNCFCLSLAARTKTVGGLFVLLHIVHRLPTANRNPPLAAEMPIDFPLLAGEEDAEGRRRSEVETNRNPLLIRHGTVQRAIICQWSS